MGRGEWVDRDAVLHATDLRALATSVCGAPRGRGASAMWRCPDPAHPDEHPSMGIFRAAAGYDRWKCLSCGQGGTAVDLLVLTTGISVGEALRDLAAHTGLPGGGRRAARRHPRPPADPPPAGEVPRTAPDPAIPAFVRQAAGLLWAPIGAGARTHLAARGFTDELLAAHQVGFDPGPRHLPRRRGLPFRGPGIVYPVHDPDTTKVIYYQVRYLDPGRAGRKYDQPAAALAVNPHIAMIGPSAPGPERYVVVCEGIPDGLTVAHTGVTAVAVLGVSHAGTLGAAALADLLVTRYPNTAFAVCFDVDTAPGRPDTGQDAAGRLGDHLAHHGTVVARLRPPATHNDLNDWWRHDPAGVAHEITGTAAVLRGWRPPSPPTPGSRPLTLRIP